MPTPNRDGGWRGGSALAMEDIVALIDARAPKTGKRGPYRKRKPQELKPMPKGTTMPLFRIAELEIDPVQLDAYRGFVTEQIDAAVTSEPGVLMLYAVAIAGRPDHIRVVEVYADQAAYEAHLRAPHFLKYKSGTVGMVRSLRLVETDPIILRAKGDENSN